jgi:hypothetical protein
VTLNLRELDAERWAAIDRVLEIVLELPVEEQESALDRLCGGEPVLRAQALEVLRADRRSSGFLARSALALLRQGKPGSTGGDGMA